MGHFLDTEGRAWSVVVNPTTAKRVRERLGVNLFNVFSHELERVFSDTFLLIDVLFVLIEQQAQDASVSADEFGEAMDGDAIEAGAEALLDAVAESFPTTKRQAFRRIIDEGKKVAAMMNGELEKALDELDLRSLISPGGSK